MNSGIAALYLLLVAALWGLTIPLVGTSVETQDPLLFVALRFSLAAVFVLPYFLKNITKTTLIVGSILGVVQAGAFITQTVGLETVGASRAAFLLGINVLLVPFLSPLFKMDAPTRHDLISALICCLGIYVLTECNIGQLSWGDGWMLGSALLTALTVVYIGKHSKSDMDPRMLSYSQIVMTALFAWIPVFLFANMDFAPFKTVPAITTLLICSLFATILAITLQSKYQRFVSLQYAALIYSLEPVFAAFFDYVLTGALPNMYTVGGGIIILVSIVYLEMFRPKQGLEAAS